MVGERQGPAGQVPRQHEPGWRYHHWEGVQQPIRAQPGHTRNEALQLLGFYCCQGWSIWKQPSQVRWEIASISERRGVGRTMGMFASFFAGKGAGKGNKGMGYLGTTPHPLTVTTRIITFLIGNPNLNLHLWLESWVGGRPKGYHSTAWMFSRCLDNLGYE